MELSRTNSQLSAPVQSRSTPLGTTKSGIASEAEVPQNQATDTTAAGQQSRIRRAPRELTYEIVQAAPQLVISFKEARANYHEAIYTWWHSKPRTRGEAPTEEDWEMVKLDHNVQRAGRILDAIDAELTKAGTVVRVSTLKNDRTVQRQIRTEERLLDKEFYARLSEENGEPGRPTKKRKALEEPDEPSLAVRITPPSRQTTRTNALRASTDARATQSPAPSVGSSAREGAPNEAAQAATRRSSRGKAAPVPVNAPPAEGPVTHQAPRKQHYEFLRAPPELVSAFRDARTAYHDAVYAWWYSVPRGREERPTVDDIARAKADPRVQRAGRLLNEIDVQLTQWGTVVKTSTLTSGGWAMHKRVCDEELRLDQEQRELHEAMCDGDADEPRPAEVAASTPDDDARPAKRKRVGAARSLASTSTSRASTHDTTMTTPEPDSAEGNKRSTSRPQRLKRTKSSRK
ncbi:hypothetical protein AURDEDRAFT_185758 [Auricularia subglabra TFB-10046 SS5]|nr:hypothetical protein AURDEDRAFT_185758 [Auricularia subglabra TFB-10046 SS5]